MTPSANLTSIIVIPGFGIAAGIAVLYHILTNPDSRDESNRNRPPPRRRQSPSPSPSRYHSSPERCSLRAILPPPEIRTTQPAAAVATSSPGNGVRREPGEISNCQICKGFMRNLTIELDCRHIFHDECYTIWRYGVVMCNPHAKLCPIC